VKKKRSRQSSTKSSTPRTGTKPKSGWKNSPPTSPASSGGSGIGKIQWKKTQLSRNVFQVSTHIDRNKAWEFWTLLVADQHHDNPKSKNDLELKHLREAKARGAAIISVGDTFCLMQGKYDKRSSKASVRPEHQVDNYIDAVVNTGVDFYEPFAQNFVCFGVGNHEQAIANRHETHVIDRLVGALNARTNAGVSTGGFSGFVVFCFEMGSEKGRRSTRIALHYDHGYGGGGAVTSDMIQHHRRAVYLPDADIVISGHTHDAWMRELSRVRLTNSGEIRHDIQTHIKLPTYKEEYGDGYGGWHVETGKTPRPLGGWWIRFYYDRSRDRVFYEVIRAQ
jgi:UDP-2,3-diacylglucosamine pyrophosphatase LpxH